MLFVVSMAHRWIQTKESSFYGRTLNSKYAASQKKENTTCVEVLLLLGGLPSSQTCSHLGANHSSPQRFAWLPASLSTKSKAVSPG